MLTIERVIPEDEIIDAMHGISLAGDSSTLPYEHADISIEEIALDDTLPTTLYVIRRGLHFQYNLRKILQNAGHDSLFLEGGLQLNEEGSSVGLIPPIVEDDPEHGPCLIDGAHRAYVARQMGHTVINVIHIRNALPSTPIYALPNSWGDILEYDDTPSDPKLKKHYRDGDYRSLYRDFSKLNGSMMREPSQVTRLLAQDTLAYRG